MNIVISTEATSDKFIHINSCDCQHLSGNTGTRRPNGRVDYQLLYIAKGICTVTVDDEEIIVPEGSVIIYPPGQPQIYRFEPSINSILYYVHFTGVGCDTTLKELDLHGKMILNIGKSTHIENSFNKMIEEFRTKKPFYEQLCSGHLINILSYIARKQFYQLSDISYTQSKIISDICKIMHNKFDENLSVDDYAGICNLSTSRFTHIFTKTIGISPKQYLIKIKIEKAIELLENTELPIARIAELVGIADCNYFSRVFKKRTGYPPGFYRY